MSRKKLPSELTLNELLKNLEEAPEPQEKEINEDDYKNDILGFLHFYKIESGGNYVSTRLLYQLYKQWSLTPLKQREFAHELSKFLDRPHSMGYCINQKGIQLSASAFRHYTETRKIHRTQSAHYHRHFTNFLNRYELKPGKKWVPWFVLYFLYDKWTYSNQTKNYLSEDLFLGFLRIFFKQRRKEYKGTSIKYYGISDNFFNYVTPEQMKSIINARLKRETHYKKDRKRKKEIIARTDKISGTKSTGKPGYPLRRTD